MSRSTTGVESAADARLYRGVAWALRAGLLISIAVMAVGLILAERQSRAQTLTVLPLDRIVPELLKGRAAAILDSGILLLFLSPLVAIVVALAGFAIERDWRFVAVTVLLVLMALAGVAVAVR